MTKNMESKFGGPRIEKIMASIIKKKMDNDELIFFYNKSNIGSHNISCPMLFIIRLAKSNIICQPDLLGSKKFNPPKK